VLVPASSWDDGTLGLLHDLPVDLVKVDVVQGLNPKRLSVFAAALADRDIKLLASRVESAELLRLVVDSGVDLAQGFALGFPAASVRDAPSEESREIIPVLSPAAEESRRFLFCV
jgi:EAL domain-containing protein (putative c-di-GMP-specific phosphodiesterase class I)